MNEEEQLEVARERRVARRAFVMFGVGSVGSVAGFRWLRDASRNDGISWPLRRGLNASSSVQRVVLGTGNVATYSVSEAEDLKVNGRIGMSDVAIDPASWTIALSKDGQPVGTLPLTKIRTLTMREQTVDHKCIEGWNRTVTWTGVRLADVMDSVRDIVGDGYNHVGFATANNGYQVTLDRNVVRHRQTLLAFKLNGEDLTPEHGSPVRLAVPTRYGIKSLKQVASMNFAKVRQPDYWGARGYDYDASF
jgi:hypothetical protein